MSDQLANRFRRQGERRAARVCVVGLGYVGLPLAEAFVHAGFPVIGFDTDEGKTQRLGRGESHIGHIESSRVARLNDSGRFRATINSARLAEADAIVICVPTPLKGDRIPDLSHIESAGRVIARHLHEGQLVVLTSTSYPGTTQDVLLPILEESGLLAGKDFFLAYSPEREDPGNHHRDIPRVVGGHDAVSSRLAAMLLGTIAPVVPVSSIRVAEACKILENTYRAVNIALVNELKSVFTAMGIDVWEVIEAAKTKPFGYQAFYPGPGLGGHCIPIDPFYLTWAARKHGLNTRFIELAGEVNTAMPQYVVDRVVAALNDEGKAVRRSKICVLGVAYKKDVDDPRESPAFPILLALQERGAKMTYHDPHVEHLPKMRNHAIEMSSSALTKQFLDEQDCVLIITDHTRVDYQSVALHARLVVDTRNVMSRTHDATARVVKA